MARITIDGKEYEAEEGQNLLHACLSLGLDLPYFCWHPALGSVGACRQCAVTQYRDEADRHGRLVMACMTPVQEGLRVALHDGGAQEFRAGIIEWMMTNHPHDCPVCDEGGECHLQDMTVMSGHTYRRFRFEKRTFENQQLGPFIEHEMNRCITCYRCVRFYRDYAGGSDLEAFASKNHVYFGRHADGPLESEFAGNLVEVCPTGVFTDKTLHHHYARKWDLESAPSLCVHCSLGCNTLAAGRDGVLRRILNRHHPEINGHFLCDRGRFGYQFVDGERRLRVPLLGGEPVGTEAAAQELRRLLEGRCLLGIGSPRAGVEANFALRTLVGEGNFSPGMTEAELERAQRAASLLRDGSATAATLADAERADAVLVLGDDPCDNAPRLALTLRQSVRGRSFALAELHGVPRWQDFSVRDVAQELSPLFLATPAPTRLDDVASRTLRAAPPDIARFGFAVAHAIDPEAPPVDALDAGTARLAATVAAALTAAERPLLVCGTGGGERSLLEAAGNVLRALARRGASPRFAPLFPECNGFGAALLGGEPLEQLLERAAQAEAVVVLENDLFLRLPEQRIGSLLHSGVPLVVLDHTRTRTVEAARLALPSATFAEATGTLVNNEGRAQRLLPVLPAAGAVRAAWRWLDGISGPPRWRDFDELVAECAATLPPFSRLADVAPSAAFRLRGQKVPRESFRYSGRTALHAPARMHEPAPPADPDTPLAWSMEGAREEPPAALVNRYWLPGWNSVQALNRYRSEAAGTRPEPPSGVRLLEPAATPPQAWFTGVPQPFTPPAGFWLALPLPSVFGGEELSALAPAVAERSPPSCLLLDGAAMEALGVAEGEAALIEGEALSLRLPVLRLDGLPPGVVGLRIFGGGHRRPEAVRLRREGGTA